ncbi:hypothetical protein B0A49_04721 [Cryomyces minteri]|uniref:VOC domain-containing protein n=1 Tax=Cryomyces minteri TaxID=331657 RepID=A0A4U0XEB9_9PEZI|nr:hypothetical protein B0A49_04721 [Cryomyces minteri]
MTPDFDHPGAQVKAPARLAHVVLRTNQLSPMVAFYKTFLGASVTFESASMAFLTYDDEHHRIALLDVPGTRPKVPSSCGLEHIAFTFASLSDLALAYRQRKALGVLPIWCVNHGPTTSMYYQDPDGNQLEAQVDNFETAEAAKAFMMGKAFEENPVGTDFDPEELVRRLQKGENEEVVKRRVEIGRRGFETVPLIA